jgi:hypothetical protein
MWMRPDYVAILGKRRGVPWYYHWDRERTVREMRDRAVDYVVIASLYKADMNEARREPLLTMGWLQAFSQPVATTANPYIGGYDFVLLKIDPAARDAWLAAPR